MNGLGVLFLVFAHYGNIYFFRKKKVVEQEHEETYDQLLCKFVKDGSGRKIGESVTVAEDILVIKSKERFLGVPLKHVEDEGKTLLVKGLVDFDKAYELGEQWRAESFHEMDQKKNAKGENNGF